MARIRSVHPSLFTDEAWVSCSPLARILYIGLWTDADDQGLFEWKPLQLKMRLLPGDGANAGELLQELVSVDLIKSYETEGKRFGAIKDFRKFQRPQKPNAVHPLVEIIADYVGLSATDPKPVDDQSRTGTVNVPQMEDVGEEKGEKKEANASSAGSAEPMPTDRGPEEPSAAKADPWSKDRDFLAAWAACTDKGRTRSSRAKAWTAWRNALKRETGPALAAAMARYVAEDEDAKRTGGPGFHTWLTDGRFEHWTASATASGSPTAVWAGPPALRATIVTALGEEFAAKWIDPYCSWSPMDRTLLVANAYAAKQISQELGAGWFTRNNAHIAIAPANGNDAPLLAHGAAA